MRISDKPAIDGLKLLPEIPNPENVPPDGKPDNDAAEASTQYAVASPVNVGVGSAFTVVVLVSLFTHPFPSV